jgi:hypothetical protein
MSKKLLSVIAIASMLFVSNGFAQQVPNSNFDSTWTHTAGPPAYDDPAGWATPNVLTTLAVLFGAQVPAVYKDSLKVYNGHKYAMRIVTEPYTPGGITTLTPYLPNGKLDFAFTGTINVSSQKITRGYPEVNRYAKLDFFAAYTPNGSDSATCGVMLTKWTGTKKDTIAIGGTYIKSTPSYTDFTIPLTYLINNMEPDSATIAFESSGTKTPKDSSTLWVDSIRFSGIVPLGVQDYGSLLNSIRTYPNPASGNITLALAENNNQSLSLIEIYDVTGRKADAIAVMNNRALLNTSSFANGLYMYSAYNEKKELIGVGKFNVLH